MDIRQKRYSLDLKPRQKKFNIGLVVKIALIAAAVIAVIILAKYFYDLSQIRTSYLAGKEEITKLSKLADRGGDLAFYTPVTKAERSYIGEVICAGDGVDRLSLGVQQAFYLV